MPIVVPNEKLAKLLLLRTNSMSWIFSVIFYLNLVSLFYCLVLLYLCSAQKQIVSKILFFRLVKFSFISIIILSSISEDRAAHVDTTCPSSCENEKKHIQMLNVLWSFWNRLEKVYMQKKHIMLQNCEILI